MPTMNLPVILTEPELILKGEELAQQVHDLAGVESRKKAANSAFKEEIESLEIKIASVARIVRERREYREVEVKDVRDEERMLMNTVRLDTGEVVSYRDLKGHERNLKLFPASVEGSAASS
jgi:hypothetical protein